MITVQQIKERVEGEKDPLRYIDGEVARCADLLGDHCQNVRDTITAYNQRANESDQIDIRKIKEELMKTGETYYEITQYLKVRKDQVKRQKRAEQLNQAMAKRQKHIDSS